MNDQLIAETERLIANYVKATGSHSSYEILRSYNVGGHNIFWAQKTYYMVGDKELAQPYVMNRTLCDCNFTEGIGWNIDENGRQFTIFGHCPQDCLKRPIGVAMRYQELRDHLEEVLGKPDFSDDEHLITYVMQAIEELAVLARRYEMIGDDSSTDGKYLFRVGPVMDILNVTEMLVYKAVIRLKAARKFELDGAIVMEWTEPPEPKWRIHDRVIIGGRILERAWPTHDRMPQAWKLTVSRESDGMVLMADLLELRFSRDCGIEPGELQRSTESLNEMLAALDEQTT